MQPGIRSPWMVRRCLRRSRWFISPSINRGGVLSDEDPLDVRRTVRDLVPVAGHLFSVGRLDLDSEGLILLTNDGQLANRLTHPRYGHEKEYRVLVASHPDAQQLEIWRRGVVLEDGYRTQPAQVFTETTFGKGMWLRVILREGRKRQIREIGRQIGLPVVRIVRVRIGSLLLGSLKPGEWRNLTPQEVEFLSSTTASPKTSLRRASQTHRDRPSRDHPRKGQDARRGHVDTLQKPPPVRKPPARTDHPTNRRPPAIPFGRRKKAGPSS